MLFTCARAILEYDAYDVSLNVFYSPILKDVVGHHKLCNEVMFWFTQMMCYNVYNIPMLIRQANDVEENPGPQYLISLIRQPLCLLTLVKEMKHSLVRMLVSNTWQCHLLLLLTIKYKILVCNCGLIRL